MRVERVHAWRSPHRVRQSSIRFFCAAWWERKSPGFPPGATIRAGSGTISRRAVGAIGWEMLAAAMPNGNRAVVLCAPRASRDREDFGQGPPTLRRSNRGVRAHADT